MIQLSCGKGKSNQLVEEEYGLHYKKGNKDRCIRN